MNIKQILESEKNALLAHRHIQLRTQGEHGSLLALDQKAYVSSAVFSYLPLPYLGQPSVGVTLEEGSAHSTFQGGDVAGFGIHVLLAGVNVIKAGAGGMALRSPIEVDRGSSRELCCQKYLWAVTATGSHRSDLLWYRR